MEATASTRQKEAQAQILALQAKLEDSRIELDTCKQEKDIMEEKTRNISIEAAAIAEKVKDMETAMLDDKNALHEAQKERDALEARLVIAEKATLASQEEANRSLAALEQCKKTRKDMETSLHAKEIECAELTEKISEKIEESRVAEVTIDAASEELSRKMQAWAKEKHEQEEELRESFEPPVSKSNHVMMSLMLQQES